MTEDDRVSYLRHPHGVGLPAISEYGPDEGARRLYHGFDDDEFYPDALRLLNYAVKNRSLVGYRYARL
jgi:hypothetical protein